MVPARGWEWVGSYRLMDLEFQLRRSKKFWRRMVVMAHNNIGIPNATELNTLK